jgi:hypothetical protein
MKYIVASLFLVGCSGAASVSLPTQDAQPTDDTYIRDASVDHLSDAKHEASADAGCGWCLDAKPPPTEGGIRVVDTDSGLARTYITNSLTVAGSITLDYTLPEGGITEEDIGTIVADAITSNTVPYDPNAVYYLLTSKEITVANGYFCYYWCGLHSTAHMPLDGGEVLIHYAMTGDVSACPAACDTWALSGNPSPNGNWTADGMTNIMAGDLTEMATDPIAIGDPAWMDQISYGVSGACGWDFQDYYVQYDGAPYNVAFGGRNWLLQQLWARNETQENHCELDLNGDPGFDTSTAIFGQTLDAGDNSYIPALMEYWGGPVMTQPISVWFLWLGTWSSRPEVEPILTDFINNIGGSTYWDVIANNPNGYFEEPSLLGIEAGVSDGGVGDAATLGDANETGVMLDAGILDAYLANDATTEGGK